MGLSGKWLGSTATDLAIYSYAGSKISFFTNSNSTERMVIDTTGNVGIGRGPTSYIQVMGTGASVLMVLMG